MPASPVPPREERPALLRSAPRRAGRDRSRGGASPRRGRSRLLAALVATVAVLAGGLSLAAPASAAGVVGSSVTVSYAGTGYGTADQCPLPADVSGSDLVTCTQDSVGYAWNYNVTGSAEPTVATFSQTVPAGVTFDPSDVTVCQGSPSTFSGVGSITTNPDGSQTLVCEITFPPGGSLTGNIPITVRVGGVADGTQLQPVLEVSQPGGPSTPSVPDAVTVIGAPNVDLRKWMTLLDQGEDVYDGRDGYVVMVSQAMLQSPFVSTKGYEPLQVPVTWTDDLSSMPAGTELVFGSWGGYTTADASTADCYATPVYGIPQTDNSLSSVLECTQPAPGAPISFALTAADLSGTRTGNYFEGAGVIYSTAFSLFIPRESVPLGAAGATFENQLTAFDPVSLSGQSNYAAGFEPGGAPGDTCADPVANDNCAGVHLINVEGSGPGAAGKWVSEVGSCEWQPAGGSGNNTGVPQPQFCHELPGAVGNQGGVTTPGARLYDTVFVQTGFGFENTTGLTLCDKWDPAEQRYDDSRTTHGYQEWLAPDTHDQTDIRVQYTTADYTDPAVRASAGCGVPGDDATDGPWYDAVADVPGGAAAISGVRVTYANPIGVPSNSRLFAYIPLINVSDVSATPRVDQLAGRADQWATPENPTGSRPLWSASYVVTRTIASLLKDTVPSLTTVGAGNTVAFRLRPVLTSGLEAPEAEVVTVTDTLDACALNPQLAAGSAPDWTLTVTPADVGADGVACTGDDVSGAVLLFTSATALLPNTPLPAIDYTVVVAPTAADNTQLTNTAVVSTPGSLDLPEQARTATKTVLVRSSAQISIVKASDVPVVEIEPDGVGWTVTVSNTSTLDAGSTQWIDVLPWNGDGRGTAFSGALNVTGVTGLNAGLTQIELTAAAPASIVADPDDPSNGPGGATAWCLPAGFGATGCPADWSEVTGVRFTAGDFDQGAVTGIHIAASPTGNVDGDVYVNQVGPGIAANIVEPLPDSNPAQVEVVSSSLGDRVWRDENADGVQDPGEEGIPGVTVELLDAGGSVVATTVTGVGGLYLFDGLHSGSYATRVVAGTVPEGLRPTYDLAHGTNAPDGTSGAIALGIASDFLDADFGYDLAPAVIAVEKAVTGDAAPFAVGPYEIVVSCALAGEVLPGFPQTLTFTAPGTQEVETIADARCSATETDDGGATSVVVTPAGGVIAGTDDVLELTVTNTFDSGSLVIVKELAGPGAEEYAYGEFVFDVRCSFAGTDPILEEEVVLERSFGDDLSALVSDPIDGLPAGAECVVTEVERGLADATPPAVTVTIPSDGAANTVFAGFVNEFSAGTLALSKALVGDGAGSEAATQTEFRVLVTCRYPLVGEDGETTVVDVYSSEVGIRGGETFVLADEAGVPIPLPAGTRCFGEETFTGGAAEASVDFDSYENAAVVVAGEPDELQELTITATNRFGTVPPAAPTPSGMQVTGGSVGGVLTFGLLTLGLGVVVYAGIWVRRRRTR